MTKTPFSATNKNKNEDPCLSPGAKKNLVDFFNVLREIGQEKELKDRLSAYSSSQLEKQAVT